MAKEIGEPQNEFGRLLRKKREEKGYSSQASLAKATGIRGNDISKYETKGTHPSNRNLAKLNKELDYDFGPIIEKEKMEAKETEQSINNLVLPKKDKSKNLQGNSVIKVVSSSSNQISLNDALGFLNGINRAWIHKEKNPFISFLKESYLVEELDYEFNIKEDYILLRCKNIDRVYLFYDVLGPPTAHDYMKSNNGFLHYIWISCQLSELDQSALINKLFPKGHLHYYNNRLSWIVMKTIV